MKKSEKTSKQSQESSVGRRQFLQIAATTGAAGLVSPIAAMAGQQQGAARPSGVAVNDTGALPPVRAGSDFMVDVIKSLGFEYVAANPGSHHRSLHESTINYGGNKNPELLTCLHEEISAAQRYVNTPCFELRLKVAKPAGDGIGQRNAVHQHHAAEDRPGVRQ